MGAKTKKAAALVALALGMAGAMAAPQAPTWRYSDGADPVTKAPARWAAVQSANVVQLSAPYAGGTRATLTVRDVGGELALYLTIDRGQLWCPRRCDIITRVDDADAADWGAVPADAGNTRSIFLGAPALMLDRITAGRVLVVSVDTFRDGPSFFRFNVAGLRWPDAR